MRDCFCGADKGVCPDCMQDYIDFAEDVMGKIEAWVQAYPIESFPEPDFRKAAEVLEDNGIKLGQITASNMRHVLRGIKALLEA